jgi:hypothetical protein
MFLHIRAFRLNIPEEEWGEIGNGSGSHGVFDGRLICQLFSIGKGPQRAAVFKWQVSTIGKGLQQAALITSCLFAGDRHDNANHQNDYAYYYRGPVSPRNANVEP